MIPNKKIMLLASASISALSLGSSATYAQDQELKIEEILVTAQKRTESVQDVPIAMTAFDAAFVERTNLDDVKDLVKFSPGFSGDSKDSFIDFISVRGISTNDFGVGGDPSIGFFKNGLYQGRQGSAVSSLFDLERAEVLRGPQGFLFGRNAISGAISFYTAKPDFDDQSGYVEAGIGQNGIFEAEGAINLPISDNFAIRVAGYTSQEDGWMSNDFEGAEADKYGGHKKSAGRFTAAFEQDNWDAVVMAEYEDRKTSGTVYRAILEDPVSDVIAGIFGPGILPRANDLRSFNSDQGLGNFDEGKILSLSADINIELGFATLSSMTGYKDHEYDYAEDYDGTALHFGDYGQDQEGDYFEQELRLVSNSDGPLSWYAGVSYYKENIDSKFSGWADEDAMCGAYANYYGYYPATNCNDYYTAYSTAISEAYYGGDPAYIYGFATSPAGLLERNHSRGSYEGWGAYVEMTYAITDKLDFSAGVRYTKDTKDFAISILPVSSDLGPYYYYGYTTDGFINTSRSWDDFTPRFNIRYRPHDDMTMYASVTKGFKSGGFGSFGAILNAAGGPEDVYNKFTYEETPDGVNDDTAVAMPGAVPDHFDPETVWSYEVGIKGKALEGRVRYDFNAYHYKYKDMQLTYFDQGSKVDNVGKVKAFGIEGSVQAIVSDSVDVLLSGSYNSNEISGAELISEGSTGNRLSGTPKFKGAGLLSYHTPVTDTGELNASVEFAAQTSVFVGIGNFAHNKMTDWVDVSLRLGYVDDAGWAVTGYIENLTNVVYFDGGYEATPTMPSVLFGAARPRTVGLKFSYRFGE